MSLFDVMRNGKNSMKAYQYAIKASTANMGNIETRGYKGLEYSFQTIFNQVLSGGSAGDGMKGIGGTNPIQLGSSTSLSGIKVNFEQGDIVEAGDMSVAVLGSGMFILSEDNGKSFLYTRNGEFTTDNEGYVVDSKGRKVYGYKVGENGEAITSHLVPIKSEGETDLGWVYQGDSGVLANNYYAYKSAIDNGEEPPKIKKMYQIALSTFPNRSGLLQYDGTTFRETDASGPALDAKISGEGYGTVYSQSAEKSNVFYIGEMMDALAVQRAMSASLTAIKFASQQIQTIIQQLGT